MYPLGCWCLHFKPSFFRHKVWAKDKEECIKVNKNQSYAPSPATDNLIYLSPKRMPPPQNYTKVRNFGNFSRLLEKKRRRRLKIGFYFFTYEWSRRRLSLNKMINGIEEVLMLLFTAFRYGYLFWSYVVRVWIVRLFILEKILFVEKTNDKKKEEAKPKLSGEKNVSTKMFRVLMWFKVWEYPFRTKAVLREYHLFLRSKYIPAQTTSRQL